MHIFSAFVTFLWYFCPKPWLFYESVVSLCGLYFNLLNQGHDFNAWQNNCFLQNDTCPLKSRGVLMMNQELRPALLYNFLLVLFQYLCMPSPQTNIRFRSQKTVYGSCKCLSLTFSYVLNKYFPASSQLTPLWMRSNMLSLYLKEHDQDGWNLLLWPSRNVSTEHNREFITSAIPWCILGLSALFKGTAHNKCLVQGHSRNGFPCGDQTNQSYVRVIIVNKKNWNKKKLCKNNELNSKNKDARFREYAFYQQIWLIRQSLNCDEIYKSGHSSHEYREKATDSRVECLIKARNRKKSSCGEWIRSCIEADGCTGKPCV